MDFGEALRSMKDGRLVRRRGWNGKGMHIYLEDMLVLPIRHPRGTPAQRTYQPFIVMFTAQQQHQPGWLASQADMLAEDWETID